MSLRVLIVDDEALAREKLRTLLASEPDVVLVGECADGLEALAWIERDPPDLMFLDVQMPELNGFEVLDAIGTPRVPAVVFVTAYDQYALRAFEVHALDYLLKPFDRERFQQALARARSGVTAGGQGLEQSVRALLDDLRQARAHAQRLIVKSGGRVFFVPVAEIDWVQAAGNYVELHAGTERHLWRETMQSLVARLDPEHFVRIHRSVLVNMRQVRHVDIGESGEYAVTLQSGRTLPVGRAFRRAFRARIDKVG